MASPARLEPCVHCNRRTERYCEHCQRPLCMVCAVYDVDMSDDPPQYSATHYECLGGCEEATHD